MADVLTSEQILEAAQDVLRRYGPAKATVIDVARALGVSHGSVYRHFPSKAALREAVTERWLARIHGPLAEATAAGEPAAVRVRNWLAALFAAKRIKVLDDPELFATYQTLINETSDVVAAHLRDLAAQLAAIIADGMAGGEFAVADPHAAAVAVLAATARYHDPCHARSWTDPGIQDEFQTVCDLLLRGLSRG